MKPIKALKSIFIALVCATSLASCHYAEPGAGQECVLVYQPAIFGHGGVDPDPISTGATLCVFSTEKKYFTITPMTLTEDFTNMIPSDNTPVSFSAYLKVQIRKGSSPELYKEFGENWYEHSLQASFRTMVRDKACVYKMFDLASKREISAKLEQEIFKDIQTYAQKIGLPVDVLQVSIGAIVPPEQILTETKLTAAQNQSILTQQARAQAELSRKQAEENKAIADQAYQRQMNMSIAEYLHLRQLEIEKEKVELIKDNKNVSIIFGGLQPTYPVK